MNEPVRYRLPETRRGITHRFVIGGQHKGYLTVGLYENGQPGEIFIEMSKEGSPLSGLLDTIAVEASMLLQHGVPMKNLVAKFANTRFEPCGMTSNPCIPMAESIVDYVFRWLGMKFLTLEEMTEVGVKTRCGECGKAEFCESGTVACTAVKQKTA